MTAKKEERNLDKRKVGDGVKRKREETSEENRKGQSEKLNKTKVNVKETVKKVKAPLEGGADRNDRNYPSLAVSGVSKG